MLVLYHNIQIVLSSRNEQDRYYIFCEFHLLYFSLIFIDIVM